MKRQMFDLFWVLTESIHNGLLSHIFLILSAVTIQIENNVFYQSVSSHPISHGGGITGTQYRRRNQVLS